MRFWDSSAVVPLLVAEPATRATQRLYRADPAVIAWWGTELECASALARRQRERRLAPALTLTAFERLAALQRGWHEVEPGEELRESARRFLRVHPLSAADALQLAAAFQAAEGRPSTLAFVSLDDRLVAAARSEGFRALIPS
ncbi:MAG: type II toxin-antitoxin system VapC family toxin [Candidatus Rokubacteria bacterium]|nr:type II toxin-antitoxin system VapC family toxin [Candidatus Rokubacteria bacterium]